MFARDCGNQQDNMEHGRSRHEIQQPQRSSSRCQRHSATIQELTSHDNTLQTLEANGHGHPVMQASDMKDKLLAVVESGRVRRGHLPHRSATSTHRFMTNTVGGRIQLSPVSPNLPFKPVGAGRNISYHAPLIQNSARNKDLDPATRQYLFRSTFALVRDQGVGAAERILEDIALGVSLEPNSKFDFDKLVLASRAPIDICKVMGVNAVQNMMCSKPHSE